MPDPIGLGLRRRVERYILAAVANISAFPVESVREDHRLIAELGFDSLMLVDLTEDISKEWPQVGTLPYETLPE
ncbi:acyl carrier protein, partial [Acinetobacter baumannii]